MIKASIAVVLFVFGFAANAVAQTQSQARGAANTEDRWPAVGRLVQGPFDGTDGCTATLIAPDLILTAGHCLGQLKGHPDMLARLRFYAGLADGRSKATRQLKTVFVAKNYVPAEISMENIRYDWAIGQLAQPIYTIQPLALGNLPGPWETVSFAAYSGINTTTPLTVKNCPQEQLQTDLLLLGCKVIGGNSGAPVIAGQGDTAVIIAVISSAARTNALAIPFNDEMRAIISAHQ